MGWFKKKEKIPVTSNTLCIHIAEDKLNEKAYELMRLNWIKDKCITKKNRQKENKKFQIALSSFSIDIKKQYPWITLWSLSEVNKANHISDYYLHVIKHTLDI